MAPPESHDMDNTDGGSVVGEAPKSKRPGDGKFKQQKLRAWKPILTPQSVLPNVLLIGVVFIAVGAALFSASNSVKEQEFDYTQCTQVNNAVPGDVGEPCGTLLDDRSKGYTNHTLINGGRRCECFLRVNLTESFGKDDTYLYYELDEFYQNHRAYIKSRWDAQLRSVTAKGNVECDPLNTDKDGNTYAPCGLVANSLFNDTIRLVRCTDPSCSTFERVRQTGSDISWESDRKTKFSNPPVAAGQDLCDAFVGVKPPNWPVDACNLGEAVPGVYNPFSPEFNSSGRGYKNEDLIVWMRSAALPNFRKLYRRIVNEDLSDGQYGILIDYNYPVLNFKGKKRIVLSTVSWQGGKNPFLGICYLVVGCLCVLSAAVFAIMIRFRSRELGSEAHLEWR